MSRPTFRLIKCKTQLDYNLFTRVFPRFKLYVCCYFEPWHFLWFWWPFDDFSLGLVTLNRKPLRENYRIKGNVEYVVDKSVIKCVTELPGCNDRLNHNQRYTDGRDCLLRRIWGHPVKTCNRTQPRGLDLQAERKEHEVVNLHFEFLKN